MGLFASHEKRVLVATTIATLVGYLMQIIAIGTTYWSVVEMADQAVINSTVVVRTHSGIWITCVVERVGSTREEKETCTALTMFPPEEELKQRHDIDSRFLDFRRTQAAFSIIGMIVMFLAHLFAFYTFRRPRYIHKRLTALLHVMVAASILVINEVFSNSVNYAKQSLHARHPLGSTQSYGSSFILSWFVFVIYIIAFVLYLVCSHKRKHEMADSVDVLADEDEPVHLGRV